MPAMRWQVKPPPGWPIDWSHPLAVGLRDAFVLNEGAGQTVWNGANPVSTGAFMANTVTWKPGKSGIGIDAGGTSNGIQCSRTWDLGFTNASPFTIAARIFPTSTTSYQTIYNDIHGNNGFQTINGKLSWYPRITVASPTTIVNRWADVAATFDGTTLRLWLDGQQESSYAGPLAGFSYYVSGGNATFIGGEGADPFSGIIDHVHVWQRPLSQAELQALVENPYRFYGRPLWMPDLAVSSGGASYTASATIAGVGAVSATALREQFPAATIPGTGAVAATALREQFPSATVAGVGALSATADRTAVVVASIAGASSLTAAAVREAVVSVTIAAAGSLSATFAGVNTQYAAATIAGVSDVQATAARSTFATATIGGVGTLSATLNSEILCAVSIAGTGTVTATAIRGQFAAAIVSAVGSVAATATATGDLGGPVRDYHLLADAVERLKATGLFDDVYLASPGEYAGVSTFTQLAFVYQTGFAWDDMGTTGDNADVYRTVEYRVAIIARDTDPTRRYARLDQAGAAASNALSGVRLADATMPVDTRLRLGRYVAFPPPLAGLELRGEARRIVAGYDANDVTDDIDDLDP